MDMVVDLVEATISAIIVAQRAIWRRIVGKRILRMLRIAEMMLASVGLKKEVEISSTGAEKQAKADMQNDLHDIKAVLEKIQPEEKEYSPFSMEMLEMCIECKEDKTADAFEAYEMQDFVHACL